MRFHRAVPLTLLLFTVIACEPADDAEDTDDVAVAPAPAFDIEASRTAVGKLRSDWVAAAERDDAATVASYYADDAVFIDETGKVHEGKDAIQTTFAEGFKVAKDLTVTEKTFDGNADISYETGEFKQTVTSPAGKTIPIDGKYLVISRRQPDGTWKIVRHVSVAQPPAAN